MRRSTVRRSVFVIVAACAVCLLFLYAGCRDLDRNGKQDAAHVACQSIIGAIEAYRESPENVKHEYPRTLDDLIHPPWGGASYVKNGASDLLDPWGKPFQIETRQAPDGRAYIWVWTTASDGTRISQFGIGKRSLPEGW